MRSITSRVDGSLVLPGNFLLQTNTNIEFIVKINQNLRIQHAGFMPYDPLTNQASHDILRELEETKRELAAVRRQFEEFKIHQAQQILA